MSKTLTIRNNPDSVYQRFVAIARRNHRNAEAHGRFLIELETEQQPLETCGELLEAYLAEPPPKVDVKTIEKYQASRGRRSSRP